MRSGRSLAGKGRFSRGHLVMSARPPKGGGTYPLPGTCIATVAPTETTEQSSSAICLRCGATAAQASVHEEHSRFSDGFVSSGYRSDSRSGHLPGHLPEHPRDSLCTGAACSQHSVRTPTRQRFGIPTKLQTTAASARIRMNAFYGTPWRAPTNFCPIAVSGS